MRSGTVLTAIAFAVVAGTSSSAQSPTLPGTIVDIKATEFAFLAPDSIPAGLTTFRLLQTGMVEEIAFVITIR